MIFPYFPSIYRRDFLCLSSGCPRSCQAPERIGSHLQNSVPRKQRHVGHVGHVGPAAKSRRFCWDMNLTQQNFGFPGVHPLFPTSCPMMSYDFFPGPLDGQDLRHELAGRGLRGQHPDALEQITPQMVGKHNKKLWKITMLLMGKSTISTGPWLQ